MNGILHRVTLVAQDGAHTELQAPAGRALMTAAAQHGLRITSDVEIAPLSAWRSGSNGESKTS